MAGTKAVTEDGAFLLAGVKAAAGDAAFLLAGVNAVAGDAAFLLADTAVGRTVSVGRLALKER